MIDCMVIHMEHQSNVPHIVLQFIISYLVLALMNPPNHLFHQLQESWISADNLFITPLNELNELHFFP